MCRQQQVRDQQAATASAVVTDLTLRVQVSPNEMPLILAGNGSAESADLHFKDIIHKTISEELNSPMSKAKI
jgi:hypothetical protein